ncbi:TonB-dependent receptor [bacterium]|nr:TonB-dependent receptor [bacterium]
MSAEGGADSVSATYRLEEIVIYGPRTLSNTSMVTTFTPAEIQKHGAWTVADLLRTDAGLNVTSGAKAETETRIRGFPGRDVLVLVDGRPVNPGYYGKVDLSMLPLDNAARVSVVKGPGSVAYGPNAMGGVISIITQNGLEKPRTAVESEFGDFQYRRLSLNHSRQIRRVNYWLSVYEHHSSGFRLSRSFEPTSVEDGGLRRGSGYHKVGADAKIGFQSSPTALYALSAGYHWAEKDVPPTVYSWDSPTYRTFPWWVRINTSASGNWQLARKVELKSVVFADAYHDRLRSYTGPEMREDQLEYDSELKNWTLGGLTDGRIEANRFHWVHTGFSFKRDRVGKKPDRDEPRASHHTLTGALFLQDNYRPWESTEITAGMSHEVFSAERADGTLNYWCPMVCVRRSVRENLRLRGGWSRAIRFPTLHDLYSESSGNPDLKPEEAAKFEVAVETSFPERPSPRGISLEVAFFHSKLRNQIYRSTRTERYRNIGSGTLQGWELRSTIRPSAGLSADIAYAYLNPDVSSRELMEETASNHWSLRFTAETRFHTRIRYELNYFDERPTYLSNRFLSAYGLQALSLEQKAGRHVSIFGRILNIADTDYEEELGYPGGGRRFTAGLRWES